MDDVTHANFAALETEIRRDRKELRRQHRHLRQFLAIILGAIATVFSLAFAGMGFFVGWIHSTDIRDIREFEKDLKAELLGNAAGAKLAVLTLDHENLVH